jgi:hypothetical protein
MVSLVRSRVVTLVRSRVVTFTVFCTLYHVCDFYELMFEIRTQPGSIGAITEEQLSELETLATLDNNLSVNFNNVLEYLELKEIDELKLVAIDFGELQKAPIFTDEPEDTIVKNGEIKLNLFPNPARSEVHINYVLDKDSEQGNLLIFDLTGKVVFTQDLNNQQNELILRINEYHPGVYVVHLISEKGRSIVKRLVIN